VESIVIQKKTK